MKKKMKDILDGITPEELDAFRDALTEEPAPADVDTARIAGLVARKTGLACGDTAGRETEPASATVADNAENPAAAKNPADAPENAAKAAPKKGKILKIRWKVLVPAAAVLCVAAMLLALLPAMLRGTPEDPGGNGFNGALSDDPALWDGVIGEKEIAESQESPESAGGKDKWDYSAEETDEVWIEPTSGSPLPSERKEESMYSRTEDGKYSADAEQTVRASTLTAKEYRDLDHFADWKSQLNDNGWYSLVTARDIRANKMTEVRVTHGGKPVFNTRVELLGAQGTLFTAVTDVQGRAYLFYALSSQDQDAPTGIRVGETVYDLPAGGALEIEAADAGISVTELDLMLMVDTTGSMGDEIAYLQAELEDTVKRVAAAGQNLSIRVSVNFYRDEGDEYVVKYYGFRDDIQECVSQIAAERAAGGGDTPEAVHTALDNAVNGHNWRENAVKVCFFVLDAAPHGEDERQGVNESLRKSMTGAAQKGIRIIPVVSSGADADCEYVMRTAAVLTGGTYVYLTDESGIGGGHKEAEIDKEKENETEYLNDCMVRLICEYCGISEKK